MRLDPSDLRTAYAAVHVGRASSHSAQERARPAVWQYDYLVLRELRNDVQSLLRQATVHRAHGDAGLRTALDVGSLRSPYGSLLRDCGYDVKTLDLTTDYGADFAGTAESTGRETESLDLVLCTQVLEHTRNPARCIQEFHRIIRPGGILVLSVPHVWFYHPHPGDFWRVTQEGMVALCEDNGFEVVELRVQGGTIMATGQILNFVLYGLTGKLGAPIYAIVNLAASAFDRLIPNSLFTLNVACLARRRE